MPQAPQEGVVGAVQVPKSPKSSKGDASPALQPQMTLLRNCKNQNL